MFLKGKSSLPLVLLVSRQVVLNFATHELQHTRSSCPSLSPRVCPSSYPLHWWYQPTISSSVTLFSSCPQSFPSLEFFPVSQLFTSGGQSIGDSASSEPRSSPVLLVKIQDWFPLKLTGLISLLSQGLSRVFSSTMILQLSAFFIVLLSRLYMIIGKTIALTIQTFVYQVMSLLYNTLSRFVFAFLPSSKCLLISCLQ